MVARGESSIYLRLSSLTYREKIWDHAAGVIIVQEGRYLEHMLRSVGYIHSRNLLDGDDDDD